VSTRPIDREALRAKLDAGEPLVLVETLGSRSYDHGHLPGAINLSANHVHRLAHQLLPDHHAEIVLYCASRECDAAGSVADALTALGYTNLFWYHGGKADWIAAGLPIVKGGAGISA
jgi:rhodanese-related sulfurtransferase